MFVCSWELTKCLLTRGVHLWEVKNVVFDVAENMAKCLFKRGVHLWEVKNVVFVYSWEHGQVSDYKRCLPKVGVCRWRFDSNDMVASHWEWANSQQMHFTLDFVSSKFSTSQWGDAALAACKSSYNYSSLPTDNLLLSLELFSPKTPFYSDLLFCLLSQNMGLHSRLMKNAIRGGGGGCFLGRLGWPN